MRIPKYRVWDKTYGGMAQVNVLNIKDSFASGIYLGGIDKGRFFSMHFDNCDLLQYTGCKDKNGKEIWEGDVAKEEYENIGEVFFERGAFCLKYRDIMSGAYCHMALRDTMQDFLQYGGEHPFEVLGNKYENPELLKELS